MIYFDHNATTPLHPAAREAWLAAQEEAWANPSSPSRGAARARLALDRARQEIADRLGAEPARLVFLSGATEAANAVCRLLAGRLSLTVRVAVSSLEHACVWESVGVCFPGRTVTIPALSNGVIDLTVLDELLGQGLGLVILMAANNETGVLQPWREAAHRCRAHGVPLVCDAAQWIGKLPAHELGRADYVFAAGHKFGAPKGGGFLLLPTGAGPAHLQWGGLQEQSHRAGTEDVAAAGAMAAALAASAIRQTDRLALQARCRDDFEMALQQTWPNVVIHGADAPRLGNTSCFSPPRHSRERWVALLDRHGIAAGTGAACATRRQGVSRILTAMGVDPSTASRALRISSGLDTPPADWQALAAALRQIDAELNDADEGRPGQVIDPTS